MSTSDQRLDLQIDALVRAGVDPDNIHRDHAISGGRATRRGLGNALRDLREGDTLVVWKLDRFSRSLSDLLKKLEELRSQGIGFRSLTESIDTTTAMGQLVLHMTAAFAQFERDLARERTQAGMRAARERGVPLGRKHRLDARKKAEAERLLRASNLSVKDIAKRLRVSTGTIYNAFPGGRTKLAMERKD